MARTVITQPTRITTVQATDVYLTDSDSPVFTYITEGQWGGSDKTHTVRVSRVHVQIITEGDDEPIRTWDAYVRNQLANGRYSNGEKLMAPRNVSDDMADFLNQCADAAVTNG